jgi:hypothetical protein
MCKHDKVTCNNCGAVGTPAQLLATRPRHRQAAVQLQSQSAGRLGGRPSTNYKNYVADCRAAGMEPFTVTEYAAMVSRMGGKP